LFFFFFFFSSRRRHTRFSRDWSSDVCSSDLTVDLHVAEDLGLYFHAHAQRPCLATQCPCLATQCPCLRAGIRPEGGTHRQQRQRGARELVVWRGRDPVLAPDTASAGSGWTIRCTTRRNSSRWQRHTGSAGPGGSPRPPCSSRRWCGWVS